MASVDSSGQIIIDDEVLAEDPLIQLTCQTIGICQFVGIDIVDTELVPLSEIDDEFISSYHIVKTEPVYGFRAHTFDLLVTVNTTVNASEVMCVFDGGLFQFPGVVSDNKVLC